MDTCEFLFGIPLENCPPTFFGLAWLGVILHPHTFTFSLHRRSIKPKEGWRRRRDRSMDGEARVKVCIAEWLGTKKNLYFFFVFFSTFSWPERKPQYVFAECFCLVLFRYLIGSLISYVFSVVSYAGDKQGLAFISLGLPAFNSFASKSVSEVRKSVPNECIHLIEMIVFEHKLQAV